MKRKLYVVVVLVLLMLAFSISAVSAAAPPPATPNAPIVYVSSPLFENLAAGTNLAGQIYAESHFTDINCVVKVGGQVACTIPKRFAGQSATLYVNLGGKTLIFYVKVPELQEVATPVYN